MVLNLNFRSRTGVLDAVNRVFSHVMDRRVTEINYDADARLYPGVPSEGDPATELHVLNAQGRRPQDMVLAEAGTHRARHPRNGGRAGPRRSGTPWRTSPTIVTSPFSCPWART